MLEKINDDIRNINSNIDILPKDTKKNIDKYIEYLDDCIAKYNGLLEENINEITSRVRSIENKYKKETYEFQDTKLDYDLLKVSDKRVSTSERLNLEELFYTIDNSNGNLDTINEQLSIIFENFKGVGIALTENDFIISDNVNLYIRTFLNDKGRIQDVFNEIYFKCPDIIKQIELNIKYIFYKNKKIIEEFLNNKYADFDFKKIMDDHRAIIASNENIKHNNQRYLFDKFYNKEYDVTEFLNTARMEDLAKILLNREDERNYENLYKLNKSLHEFKDFKEFEYIVKDMRALNEKREEYKDIVSNKLKDISKKEGSILGINKKIARTGFFSLKGKRLADAKLERNKIISELISDYEELDTLKIKDFIYKHVDNETTYYDLLKFSTYNFNYFVSLLKVSNPEVTLDEIKSKLKALKRIIYDYTSDIIYNINITEEKAINRIICEKYKLNNIDITVDKVETDQIDKTISDVEKLICDFDIKRAGIDLEDIKYLLEVVDLMK